MDNDLYYVGDTLVEHTYHAEDSINVVDTFVLMSEKDTTILVQKTTKEYEILEKLIERDDFGKNIFITLVAVFIIYSIFRKRNG